MHQTEEQLLLSEFMDGEPLSNIIAGHRSFFPADMHGLQMYTAVEKILRDELKQRTIESKALYGIRTVLQALVCATAEEMPETLTPEQLGGFPPFGKVKPPPPPNMTEERWENLLAEARRVGGGKVTT